LKTLPDRDEAKVIQVVEEIYKWLAGLGVARADTILAVGGGAVTDVAGFVAATWLRGIEYVNVPTTLLGAIDAGIGGKTGINLAGKNLVGSFWHPSRVIIDLTTLEGLPAHLLQEGQAEALKAGLVGDLELVEAFERWGPAVPLEVLVPRAVRVKASVVAEDFREGGRRAILNYGHTIGHAVELAAGISHGQAVAIGMVAAGAVSERRCGFRHADRQRRLIEALGLPVSSPPVDLDLVRRLLTRDKKRVAGDTKMVLLSDIGVPVVEVVTEVEIDLGLAAIGLP
jgi:3-dehydroquinate synthetase